MAPTHPGSNQERVEIETIAVGSINLDPWAVFEEDGIVKFFSEAF